MAQHGYLGDGYGANYDPDRDGERDERGRGDERWRGEGERGAMFRDRDRDDWRGRDEQRGRGRDDDRGFFGRFGDEVRSWSRDDDEDEQRNRRSERGPFSDAREWFGGGQSTNGSVDERDYRSPRDRQRGSQMSGGGRSDWEQVPRNFSNSRDDHYRSWRDKQMQALDKDYEDYCREREQQFHQEFSSWRQNRQQHDHGLRGKWGLEQGSGADEQTFNPQTTAVGNTMTTSETHEPQSTTENESLSSSTRAKR